MVMGMTSFVDRLVAKSKEIFEMRLSYPVFTLRSGGANYWRTCDTIASL
jgi:hypothetical protein